MTGEVVSYTGREEKMKREIDAADVRDLLRIAYEARDRADGGLVVITPELALALADALREVPALVAEVRRLLSERAETQ